jgi:hypothetical protein
MFGGSCDVPKSCQGEGIVLFLREIFQPVHTWQGSIEVQGLTQCTINIEAMNRNVFAKNQKSP